MSRVDTRLLVADYVLHRLSQKALTWVDCPFTVSSTPGRVEKTMRALGEEFEQRYTEVFSEMCGQLHITPNNAQTTFVTIVNELFSDEIKWGRVVALFAFGGCLAVRCIEKEMPFLVDQVVEWLSSYVDGHLMSWIKENGDWDGFVDFYENGPERRDESPWPSFKTLCGYAVGALGVLTLGAILSNKS